MNTLSEPAYQTVPYYCLTFCWFFRKSPHIWLCFLQALLDDPGAIPDLSKPLILPIHTPHLVVYHILYVVPSFAVLSLSCWCRGFNVATTLMSFLCHRCPFVFIVLSNGTHIDVLQNDFTTNPRGHQLIVKEIVMEPSSGTCVLAEDKTAVIYPLTFDPLSLDRLNSSTTHVWMMDWN